MSLGATTSRAVGVVTPIVLGGIISVTAPTLGFASAVRVAGMTAVVVGAGGSLLAYLVARVSPRPPTERAAPTGE